MLEFTESTFFWALINFFVLLFILHKFVWKPLSAAMQAIEEKKAATAAEIAKNLEESQTLLRQYQSKLDNIHLEAKKVLHDAMLETEEIRKVEIKKLQDERQRVLNSAHEVLDLEKKRFFGEAKAILSDVIISVSGKVLQKELKASDHQTLITDQVGNFEKHLKEYEQKTAN